MKKNNKSFYIILFLFFCLSSVSSLAENIQNPYKAINSAKTQNFGMYRKYGLGGLEEFHNGVDLDGSFGSIKHPFVSASASGKVVYARWGKYGDRNTYSSTLEPHSIIRSYGKTVIIDHGGWGRGARVK